jgi:hypothetical protein
MAAKGASVVFHGAFASKAEAVVKEHALGSGAYIQATRIRGQRRFLVLTRRKGH